VTTLQLAWPAPLQPRVRVPVGAAGRIAWTRRGERIAFGSHDALIVADALDGKVLGRFPSVRPYSAVACARNDAYLVCADELGGIDMFRLDVGRPGSPAARHRARVNAITFSGDDWRFFTAGNDGSVGRFAAASWEARFFDVGAPVLDIAQRGAGEHLAVALGRGGVVLLNGAGKRERTLQPPGRAISVAFSSDERLLFVGTREGRLHCYDAVKLTPNHAGSDLGVGPIARLLPLGDALVLEGGGGALVFIDSASGHELMRARLGVGGGTLAVHAGQRALAVDVGDSVLICDVELGYDGDDCADSNATLALVPAGDAAAARQVILWLRERGVALVEPGDRRALVAAARSASRALVFYGPSGEPQAWQLDLLHHRGVNVIPVVLPGGCVPDEERAFTPLRYVCFGDRVEDPDALLRVERALRDTSAG
jgi:hypothetical protein